MDMTPVNSSQLAAVGYDPETKTLHIKFKDRTSAKTGVTTPGATYAYDAVPAHVRRLLWRKMKAAGLMGAAGFLRMPHRICSARWSVAVAIFGIPSTTAGGRSVTSVIDSAANSPAQMVGGVGGAGRFAGRCTS